MSDLPKSQARFSVRPVLEVAAKKGGPKGALQATIFFFHRLVVEKNKISGRQVLEEGPFFHSWVVQKNEIRVRAEGEGRVGPAWLTGLGFFNS